MSLSPPKQEREHSPLVEALTFDTVVGYRIRDRLYAGPRATVYEAVRDDNEKRVLLKTPTQRPTPRDVADLTHEYEVLSRLRGAAVIPALALEVTNGRPWLVLADLGGQPLDRVATRFRDPALAVALAARIAESLAEVHRRGIIHRDLKPEHVIVFDDGSVRLTGFRIASLLRVAAATTTLEGTLAYMAPEQTGRMNRSVDKRADLYALGVVLYELLAGRHPFEADDPLEWIHAHIAQVPAPPNRIKRRVPAAASAIVMKLLAKQPEDRYHTALGLRLDLERCAENLARGNTVEFALGTGDVPDELLVSRRLYGREREVAQLVAGFERCRVSGSAVVSLVGGYAGVGKTSIVGALYEPIVRQRGRFVAGKFDQYKRDIPYATIVEAFRELIRSILTSGEASLADWRTRISNAVGANGRLMTDVIPELELVIGPQPAVPQLGASEAQNRFEGVLLAFVRVFARPDHPLVMFLDDLQWADGATLGVLKLLARPTALPCLHLVLAYRDNEVGPGHPFQRCVETMRASGASIDTVAVRDLEPSDVTRLVADTVLRERTDPAVISLAELIQSKAGGNPFFVSELLRAIDARGLFEFDVQRRGWTWNEASLRTAEIADNVVELLVDRLRNLPDLTRRTLLHASCFGNRFRLASLATVFDLAASELLAALRIALEQGLIESVGDDIGDDHVFRFHHDRIQQAAYSLLSSAERADTHLRIGRHLRASLASRDDATLFDVVNHLDHAVALIEDKQERTQLVALNLSAARRAKAAIAWEPARVYLESAASILAEDAWHSQYRLAFDVSRELAECEVLTGRFESSDRRFDELRRRAASRADRADTASLQVRLHVLAGRYDQALALGMSELAYFGEGFPENDSDLPGAINAERARLASHLDGRDIHFIIDLPLLADDAKRALITLLASLPPAIYSRRPAVFPVFAMRMVNLSLEHGNCEASCFGYSMVAMLFAGEGDAERGFALSEASLALNEKLRDPKLLGTLLHIHANHISYWKRSFADASSQLERAYAASMDVGDLTIAAYVTFMGGWLSLERAQPLVAADQQLELFERLVRGTRSETAISTVSIQRQFVRALRGQTKNITSLSSESCDADALRARIAAAGNDTGLAMHDTLRGMLAFHAERFHDADQWFARAATKLSAAFCLPVELTWAFYNALTTAALYLESDEEGRVAARARIASAEARLRDAAHSCPENFEAPYMLVAAERARIDGRSADADQLYERAGAVARRNGQLAIEAVVGQLGARALLGRGLTRPARGLLRDHAAALGSWGATALSRVHEAQEPSSGDGHAVSNTIRAPREQLDALTALKVSQALSRESLAEGLTQTLIRLLLEHAGATRAVVLFANASRLEVVGSSSAGEAVTATRLPESVLRYVERMRTAVVLDHAAVDPTFGNDTYVTETRARSILCMPILVHSQLAGVVYLENDLVYGAFSPDRIALLEVIGTQLAISLENARLYAEREERAAQDARGAQRVDLYRHFMQADFPIAVFRGPEHLIELANPAMLAAWGRTADIVGLPLSVAVPELRDKGFLDLLDDVYRSGIRHDEQAVRARTPTGPGGALEDRYYSCMVAALRDASNAVEGIMLSAFDVTAQLLARQQREKDMALLAETTAQLQVVADRLSAAQRAGAIGIFEWAIPSSTMYWSPEMFALFGLAPNEIVPSIDEWTSRFVEPDRETARTQFTAACAARRDTYEVELRLLQPDGDTRAVRFSNRIYYDHGQPQRLIGAAVDVQSLRHAAGVERHARELAEQHVRFYELFTGILGHDLRNPLGGIVMGAELLEDEPAPAVRAELVRRIRSSGDRMGRMIDQLLDFTRIRAGGGFKLSRAPHDLAALCARTRDEIEVAARTRILVSQQGDTTAEIDEDRVLQVLSNLVGNAAYHGDAGAPVRVTLDGSTADAVAITVWNAGAIPADLVAHVFEPFRGTKTKQSTGLGLGLYITQQIVDAHGGTVEVRSTAEEGTSFTVRLPRIARGT